MTTELPGQLPLELPKVSGDQQAPDGHAAVPGLGAEIAQGVDRALEVTPTQAHLDVGHAQGQQRLQGLPKRAAVGAVGSATSASVSAIGTASR